MSFERGLVIRFVELSGMKWPDIDEDAFLQIKQPIRSFGFEALAVVDAIEMSLRDLTAGNPSQTLRSLLVHVEDVRRTFVKPIDDACQTLAGTPCDDAYHVVVYYKDLWAALIAADDLNDIADAVGDAVSLGAATPAAIAEAVLLSKGVSAAIEAGVDEIAALLTNEMKSVVDNLVNDAVNPFLNAVSTSIEGQVDALLPGFALRVAAESADLENPIAGGLRLSDAELDQCLSALASSTVGLVRAGSALAGDVADAFSTPSADLPPEYLSSTIRELIGVAARQVATDTIDAAQRLLEGVAKHFIKLLGDYRSAIEQLDADARARAQASPRPGPGVLDIEVLVGLGGIAAAGVAAASGDVDIAAAGPAVGEAEPVAATTDLAQPEAAPVPEVEVAVATGAPDGLDLPAAAPLTSVQVATSTAGGVQTVRVQVEPEHLVIETATAGGAAVGQVSVSADHTRAPGPSGVAPGSAGSVSTVTEGRRPDAPEVHHEVAATGDAAHRVEHLRPRHDERARAQERAEAKAEEVREVHTEVDDPRAPVDGTLGAPPS